MQPRSHIIISGTGRAGTTFLVELLTHLGLDTGFTVDMLSKRKHVMARAGLEHDIRVEGCPLIVKSPSFCDYAETIFARPDIAIKHVFIPIRSLFDAAESRRFVVNETVAALPLVKRLQQKVKPRPQFGGLINTHSSAPGEQENILLRKVYNLLLAASNTQVPVTLLQFPRTVTDARYLFEKLQPILEGMSFDQFQVGFTKAARPDMVHSFEAKTDGSQEGKPVLA